MEHTLLISSDKLAPIEYLKKNPVDKLFIITKKQYAHLYEGMGNIYVVGDITDLSEIKKVVNQIIKQEDIHHVVTPTEKGLLTGGYVRSFFGIQGQGFESTLAFSNKLFMKNKLSSNGIPVAKYKKLTSIDSIPEAAKELGYPLVVKPSMGSGSVSIFCLKSQEEYKENKKNGNLDKLFKLEVPIIAESYIKILEEFHCDGIVEGGEQKFLSISKYVAPAYDVLNDYLGSCVIDETSEQHQQLSALHKKVIKILGLINGVTHMEAFQTDQGIVFGEITCRPGGGAIAKTIKFNYDVNLWDAFMDLSIGRRVTIPPRRKARGYGWSGIPVKGGVVTKVPIMQEEYKQKGIDSIDLLYKEGEQMKTVRSSGNFGGFVFYKVDENHAQSSILEFISSTIKYETDSSDNK